MNTLNVYDLTYYCERSEGQGLCLCVIWWSLCDV